MSLPTASRTFGELFGDAKSTLDKIQKKMASILPSMPGQPVGKFFDLAIGIDFHATTWPALPICPVPHIGMIFDLMAAIVSAVSSALPSPPPPPEDGSPAPFSLADAACGLIKGMAPSVKVHGQWIAQAGIPIVHLPGFILHIPFPIVAPMSESEMWMGSSTVLADGGPCSTQFHPALSCNSVGFPPPPPRHPGIFKAPKKSLMAPTSLLSIITSSGNPVLVGGPPTIDLFQLMVKLGIKGLGKMWSKTKLSKMLSEAIENSPLGKIQKKINCILFGEPVDAATGRVYTNNIDFELPGPIPIQWERTYYSDAEVSGPLGYNWHHRYNMGILNVGGCFALRHSDGRESALPELIQGESYFDRKEQLAWSKDENGYWLEDAAGLLYRFEGPKNRHGYQMLSSINTKDGFSVRFRYDGKGDLFQIIDSREQKVNIDTDNEGRIVQISVFRKEDEQEIHLVRYKYDNTGNMVETIDALNVSKYFVYDGHLLTKLTNQSGLSFHWEYKGKGNKARCVHTWGDDGVLEYWMEYKKGLTTTRDNRGYTTEYYHDERSLIYKIIDANGGVTRREYNDEQELEVIVNPEGISRKFIYNDFGKIVQRIDGNGEQTTYKYDENRNITQVTSPGGASLHWEYDHYGRIIKRTTLAGNKLSYHYDGALLESITDTDGNSFRFRYNQYNDLEELLYPAGISRRWEYDSLGHLLLAEDVKGNITTLEYDKAGNVTKLTEADGNVHSFTYDKSGNLIKAKDKLREVAFAYGPMGIMKSRSQNGKSVHFDYDNYLQLHTIVNEGKEKYTFELDGLGQVVKETGFDDIQREYIRDNAGRVTKVLRPEGRWTSYLYDGTGNVVKEEQYDDTFTAYHYNADGMLIEALNEEGKIVMKRDRTGRITQEIQGGQTINRLYNKKGFCTQLTSSLGADIRMDYDKYGDLESMQASDSWRADWTRDNTGLELHRQLTGGIHIHTGRDNFGRETRKSIGVNSIEQSSKAYQWGMGNRLQGIEDELTGAHTSFNYDAFDNLIQADYKEQNKPAETIYRVPDKIGNLFEQSDRTDRKYGKGGRLKEDNNYFYHYDVEGNLCFKEIKQNKGYTNFGKQAIEKKYGIKFKASGTGWLYEWAANGMLKKVVNPEQGKIRFGYDALGRRIYKQTKTCTTHWIWNGNVPLHEWQTYDEEALIEAITWVFEMGGFVPCAKVQNGKSYSIVTDYLGTPTHMYDQQGQKTWHAQLDIYGRVRTFDGSDISDCPFRYQGQYQDSETGLYYNRFRYYDPEVGNYISQDPIKLMGGARLYGYVHDTNAWIDEFGLLGDEVEWIDPNKLNYSQAYVSENVNGYTTDMKNGDWDWDRSGPLNVAEVDGQLVSLDNRRLLAAQEAGLEAVPIKKVNLDDALPPPATGGTYGSNLKKKLKSKPKGSDVPKVQLPETGTPEKPTVVPKKPKGH
ncbi:MAG: DUF6531 domain-containing protein [Prevotella sp.]|jgi:RHS repeat-associated protein|nr:DUF6531 domain-containing protein [Prevotella sp.]